MEGILHQWALDFVAVDFPLSGLDSLGVCHLWPKNEKAVALPVSELDLSHISYLASTSFSTQICPAFLGHLRTWRYFLNMSEAPSGASFWVEILKLSSVLYSLLLIIQLPCSFASTALPSCLSASVLIFKAPSGFPTPRWSPCSSCAAFEPFICLTFMSPTWCTGMDGGGEWGQKCRVFPFIRVILRI